MEESISKTIEKILKIKQENGKITIHDIADLIEGNSFSFNDLEKLYNTLENLGIKIVNDDSIFNESFSEDDSFIENFDEDIHDYRSIYFNNTEDKNEDYFNELKKISRLTKNEEENLLTLIANGDESAKKRLLESYLYLPVEMEPLFKNSNLSYMDIIQEGNLGLMEAVNTYAQNKGLDFKAYAEQLIKEYINAAIAETERQIEKPVNTAKALNELMRISDEFYNETGRSATTKELCEKMGITEEDVQELMNIAKEILEQQSHIADKHPNGS